ncbi:ferredoxin [Lachnospiraceae bacterium C7]|nr:ferredoxin [Lachnospiraceae bacterium C7]
MRAVVDQDACIGCGLCVGTEPDVFRFNEDGKAEGFADITAATEDTVEESINSCPMGAISKAED